MTSRLFAEPCMRVVKESTNPFATVPRLLSFLPPAGSFALSPSPSAPILVCTTPLRGVDSAGLSVQLSSSSGCVMHHAAAGGCKSYPDGASVSLAAGPLATLHDPPARSCAQIVSTRGVSS
ncbi:hypothetical protein An02g03440 [Aspergillus niger]|uniref:Uncharacterized protein n=2 Tax=Aspergillus niger TaxID=5061 RepID=A2QCG0_ASPNC|nr:hypothetical protein An02g03440 [Aspergillus niger]CAK47624.1 hypothetical protein An02g03440 [Aspergillus niger]